MAKTPATPASNETHPDPAVGVAGKGRPTPSRAEQEAARRRPLVADTKEAKARARAEMQAQRDKARVGMANGDDRYLPPRDKGPQRRLVRDYVDAGWHLGEAAMPALIVVIVANLLPIAGISLWLMISLWALLALVGLDMYLTSRRVKKLARERFGTRLERGLGWYGAMRTIQMRWMRVPKPQVRRGQFPD